MSKKAAKKEAVPEDAGAPPETIGSEGKANTVPETVEETEEHRTDESPPEPHEDTVREEGKVPVPHGFHDVRCLAQQFAAQLVSRIKPPEITNAMSEQDRGAALTTYRQNRINAARASVRMAVDTLDAIDIELRKLSFDPKG